jgi:hypothetical protein
MRRHGNPNSSSAQWERPIAKIGLAERLAKAEIDGDQKIDLIGGGSLTASLAGVWHW